eukprot:4173104-Amphidinium_carterae.1
MPYTCNLKQFVMRQGDPQDPNSPCAYLCRLIDEPLLTDLRNQVLTGVRYDFDRVQIHDRGHPERFLENVQFSTARAQSSGSDTDKSKKKAKYTDAKKSVRPRESLEQ